MLGFEQLQIEKGMVVSMYINLQGEWQIRLMADEGEQIGNIQIPGILQGQGYGNEIGKDTPWVSSLHNEFWYEREEYKNEDGEWNVPFLAQPPRHFLGTAVYEKEFIVEEDSQQVWYLFIEITRWKSKLYIDEEYKGEACSLVAPHRICAGKLTKGSHKLSIEIDNRMLYPYRPDGHGVTDALGVTWNGMVGEVALFSEEEWEHRVQSRKKYALENPKKIEVKDGKFIVDGDVAYFRGTHFGGDYPLTGYPETDKAWWDKLMRTVKAYGLNFIRCHSMCPPEAAFAAADEYGVYLQPECGMWNLFSKENTMIDVLKEETRHILEAFGHHPSFVLFSPSNEPAGEWHEVLREWVLYARGVDIELGYAGRRVYTAQSGWPYEVPAAEVIGTDYLYFHRSGFGPIPGGSIRGMAGWKGKDYNSSLENVSLPVISHELGQWCAYPDYQVMEKFTGYLKPGNYQLFKNSARKSGLLTYVSDMAYCSGKKQARLYKEDLEATFRTDGIYGFELLDLHDYLGQGTALVGVLDTFWDNKGYITDKEFREFCGETVILTRLSDYIYKVTDVICTQVEISHFGKRALENQKLIWKLSNADDVLASGCIEIAKVATGCRSVVGEIEIKLSELGIQNNCHCVLEISLEARDVRNHWDIYVYAKQDAVVYDEEKVIYTREWEKAVAGLKNGKTVVYAPWMTDLDYDCPTLAGRAVFWNAQMGPSWGRPLGVVVDETHPIFDSQIGGFVSAKEGGWQWDEIVQQARGFNIDGLPLGFKPVVRVIDDWNRNAPLSLVLEGRVGAGRLILVSANLEGDYEERPVAYHLKQAILKYADLVVGKNDTAYEDEISFDAIEKHLLSLTQFQQITKDISFEGNFIENKEDVEKAKIALLDCNPQATCVLEVEEYPLDLVFELQEKITIDGIYYMPPQRDRSFQGCIKEYEVYVKFGEAVSLVKKGCLKNGLLSERILFENFVISDIIIFRVISCYGDRKRIVWETNKQGYFRKEKLLAKKVQIGGLGVLSAEHERFGTLHSDWAFWSGHQKIMTKEIEA